MLNAHTLRGYKPSGAGSECSPAQESRSREGFQKPQSQWCPALRWTGHRGSQRLKRELQHELWAPLRVGGRHYCVPTVGTLVWYGWLCHEPSVPQPPHFPGVWESQFSLLPGGTLECSICLHWVWPHRISVWSPSYFPSSYHPFGKHLKGFGTNGENLTWECCEVEREEENADTYGEWDSLYPNLPLEWALLCSLLDHLTVPSKTTMTISKLILHTYLTVLWGLSPIAITLSKAGGIVT